MVMPFEFRAVQAFYPIVLQQDTRGDLYPVALFGFQENENLFLGEDGWRAGYVPAMLRREPFLIGVAGGDDKGPNMLSIDMAHPRVSTESGEALFQPLGGRTPWLETMVELLETIHAGHEHCRLFMEALKAHGLTEAFTWDITLNDGSRNQLVGFHGIDEEKVQALDGDALAHFGRQGFLMPLFMMLASIPNVQRLVDFKNAALETSA